MTLTDFLLARIAEDEEAARVRARYPESSGWRGEFRGPGGTYIEFDRRFGAARVLAECKAKRVAVDWYLNDDEVVMGPTVEALAAVYSDHPDYREEWPE